MEKGTNKNLNIKLVIVECNFSFFFFFFFPACVMKWMLEDMKSILLTGNVLEYASQIFPLVNVAAALSWATRPTVERQAEKIMFASWEFFDCLSCCALDVLCVK
jgi:hypothetical protein